MKHSEEKLELPSPALMFALRSVGYAIGKTAWRISLEGKENIPAADGRGLVIVSNHQTYFDPYWICLPVYRPLKFMAWDRSLNWFAVGPAIRKLGAFPVNIEKGSVGTMKESLKVLAQGATLVVFPEGSRSGPDGKLQEFKPGAARLAIGANVPILPVTIVGGNKVWPLGRRYPKPGKVRIIYHKPIETRDFRTGESDRHRADALTARLRETIASAL